MDFEEILQSVTDEKLRTDLKAKYQEANQKAGEFGRKLIEKDGELNTLKTQQQTYSKAHDALRKADIAPEQIPKLLEKLGYQKTMEEEYNITKEILDSEKKTRTALEKENHRLKAEKSMGRVFDKLRSELKDDKGQPVKLAEKFIDFEDLYNVQDFSNEAVLQEKCKQVLTKGLTAQTEVLRDIGFVGAKVHVAPDGKQSSNPTVLDVKQVMETQGAAAAIAAMHAVNTSKG